MSDEIPETPASEDEFNPNEPPNPERWWKARRGHATWAASAMMLTLILFSVLAYNIETDKIEVIAPVFIAVIVAQFLIVISYIVSATYIDKVIKPFSKIPGLG